MPTIELALEGLRWFDPAEPVPMNEAAARGAAEVRAKAESLAKHGEIGRGRDRGAIGTSKRGTNQATYLAARIKRDRPDIAEAVERGEYRSIRQAAIAAGRAVGRLNLLRGPPRG